MMPLRAFSTQAFRAIDPFPPMVRRRFKYSELFSLTTGSAGVFGTDARFNMNALYDPDYAGTGHQPYGFDQLNTIYTKYRVDSVFWRVTFVTPGAVNEMLCAASVSPGTSATLASRSPSAPLEWPNCFYGILSSSGTRHVVLTGDVQLHTLCGVEKAKYQSEDNFASAITTNPAQLALLTIGVASLSENAAQSVSVLVELEYDAILYGRLIQSQS